MQASLMTENDCAIITTYRINKRNTADSRNGEEKWKQNHCYYQLSFEFSLLKLPMLFLFLLQRKLVIDPNPYLAESLNWRQLIATITMFKNEKSAMSSIMD